MVEKTLKLELNNGMVDADEYHKTIFRTTNLDAQIAQFVKMSPALYKDERWCVIPANPTDAKELYDPFFELFKHIFEHLDYPNRGRVILKTHAVRLAHKDGHNTAPDFMVIGFGDNFPLTTDEENTLPSACYRRCASVMDVKTQKSQNNINHTANTLRIATYARQCFIEQQNRRFVYGVILSEVTMRLLIFDRSGGMQSQFFNIHKEPEAFVRILLGFCSPDDKEIGFDTSIFWKKRNEVGQDPVAYGIDEPGDEDQSEGEEGKEKKGDPGKEAKEAGEIDAGEEEADQVERKIDNREGEVANVFMSETEEKNEANKVTDRAAKLRRLEEQKQIDERYVQFIRLKNHWDKQALGEKTYRVKNTLFSRDSLRGRGTTCWTVFDPDTQGRTLIIKDSWRTSERESEAQMLTKVIGLPGVGQMVAYQDDNTDRISRLRSLSESQLKVEINQKLDRTFSRIVLESYGDRLDHFKNQLHLLHAFRDAVKGHRNLWEHGILHRDVSLNNILLGQEDALDGNKGILIDLDLAIRIDDCLEGSFRTGTRTFQSINVLSSEQFGECAWPHDYLDDLESSLYCLARICGTYIGPGEMREDPTNFVGWENTNLDMAADMKRAYLFHPPRLLTPYFKCLGEMFDSLARFLCEHVRRKDAFARQQMKRLREGHELIKIHLPNLTEESKGHYNTFIGYIDEAIQRLSPIATTDVANTEPIAPLPQPLNKSVPAIQIPRTDDPTEPSRKRRPDDVDEDCESPQKKGRTWALLNFNATWYKNGEI